MAAVQSVPPASTTMVVRLVPAWADLDGHNRNETQTAEVRQERRRMSGLEDKNNKMAGFTADDPVGVQAATGRKLTGHTPSWHAPILAQLLILLKNPPFLKMSEDA